MTAVRQVLSRFNPRDAIPGLMFIAAGLFFGINSLFFLSGRSEGAVGPGTFPILLSVVMIGLGTGLLLQALRHKPQSVMLLPLLRILPILVAPVAFGLTARGAGLVPSLAFAAAIATLADLAISPLNRILIVAGITLLCTLVFGIGLRLPFGLIGPWFGG